MKALTPPLLLMILLMNPLTAVSQTSVYRTTNEDGSTVFTDTPPGDSRPTERVEVQRTNTTPPPPPQARESGQRQQADEATEKQSTEWQVAIVSPADDTTIPMGPGNFSVSARVEPAPEDGQQLQLYVDGKPEGEPQQSSQWQLTNVFRGTHELTVAVLDARGETLATSDKVRVHVLRPTRQRLPAPLSTPG